MTLQDFINKYNGQPVDFDGVYPNQCMDLMHQYVYEVLGLTDKSILAAPGAKDVYLNFPNISGASYFVQIANTPSGVPQPGDLVFWGSEIGPYGHVAIFHDGNSKSFTSFDANWPLNSLPHLQSHTYFGVLGWLHRQAAVSSPNPTPLSSPSPLFSDQTKIPLGGEWGQMELGAVRSQLNDDKRIISALQLDKSNLMSDSQFQAAKIGKLAALLADCQKASTAPKTAPNPPSTPPPDVFDQLAAFLRNILRR